MAFLESGMIRIFWWNHWKKPKKTWKKLKNAWHEKFEPFEVNVFCLRLQCSKILLYQLPFDETLQLHRIVLCFRRMDDCQYHNSWTASHQHPNDLTAETLFKTLSALLGQIVYACWYFLWHQIRWCHLCQLYDSSSSNNQCNEMGAW